ncbi:MAG: DMT family transporter [Omnitrophica WOR_2 bacterium]|jgi:drug/metabolite transporter (DMT)-like permease
MSNQKKSYLYALAAILLWSTVGTAFKITLRHLNYAQLLLFSSFISVVVLAVFLIINNEIPQLKSTTFKQLRYSALLGFLNPFAYYLILFKAYSLLRAQEAVALNYIWPMMLVLLSVPILKQKIRLINVIALLISFSGAIIIATQGKPFSLDLSQPLGVSLALSSAIFWALFWLLNVRDQREETLKLFMNFLCGFIYTLIYCMFTGNLALPEINGALGSVYIGLFEMGITFVLWLKALKYSENTARVSNLVYLSPFISLMFISVIIGERILASTIAGLVLIITGIILQQVIGTRGKKRISH